LPIEEVVIAVADMSKRSYIKDGQFQNEIDDLGEQSKTSRAIIVSKLMIWKIVSLCYQF
jgi:hypothetical protein